MTIAVVLAYLKRKFNRVSRKFNLIPGGVNTCARRGEEAEKTGDVAPDGNSWRNGEKYSRFGKAGRTPAAK
jgi:hypothetical protein